MAADMNIGTKKCTREKLGEVLLLVGKKKRDKLNGQGRHCLCSVFTSCMGSAVKRQVRRHKGKERGCSNISARHSFK